MTKFYSIGEVSRILNISSKALRHYDHISLLKPSYINEETKYRYYSYDQFFTIDVIRFLNKVLNIPLEDVKKLMDEHKNNDKLLSILDTHMEQLNSEIKRLEYSKEITSTLISGIKYRKKYPERNNIYEQYLLTRNLYYIELDISIYDIDKYVSRNITDTDNASNKENNIMCSVYSMKDYENNKELRVKGFGIFSSKKIPGLKSKIIPEGRYITHRFLYSEENCLAALQNLINYAQINNIKLDDTVYLVSDMVNVSASSKYEYYMDLQIMHKI